ncbi:molybdenum cofactor biosynthesis protein MoaE [Nocardia abscessus]|uniref:Molybdenum cofactor biosynthesis protein MoaE n=1 Tax=Nocardia abscessus TaxID=120957 RepID=A0ABS0CEK2_9NOCA|nr:molybdenum cofactor biosynthesis protein MoaE [Nocardia abscessus]MBF6228773.1 molybdenum cofactor biosynthesis protein MoaE [Nocardia abscessus]
MTKSGVRLARLCESALDPGEAESVVTGPGFGAVAVFIGKVRDHDRGQRVSALEYSAHPQAERFLREVCADVAGASGLPVAAVHRIGDLAIGDLAVVVAVAAAHRAEAFATCARLVERIKFEVPIWKRQLLTDGMSQWVNSCE